jgi:class 3 adenylate cyclase
VSLVGPSVHIAARILKWAPPGGIAATEAIVEHARRANPELARQFAPLATGVPTAAELGAVRAWVAPPPPDAGS